MDESVDQSDDVGTPAEPVDAGRLNHPFPDRCSYIVGVGASAGGLEALERLFDGIPRGTRSAYVIVQHLSPDFRSLMDQLLARHTSLEIRRAEDGMPVEPDCIYLIPPSTDMRIRDGRLQLTEYIRDRALHLPIDVFFSSLAEYAEDRAIGVVLSGTGSDGSRGIRAIKDHGGLVFVQSGESAKFDGMPVAAIGTGVVDLVAAPGELAESIAEFTSQDGAYQIEDEPEPQVSDEPLNDILSVVKLRVGVDFLHYKPKTILRRVIRRVGLLRLKSIEEYRNVVLGDESEMSLLVQDLLIGVTQFFRDPDAYRELEREVPKLFESAEDGGVRVWVAGCSTGEEAYSVAILLDEERRRGRAARDFKVFATDLQRGSLERASVGVYPETIADSVSPVRLDEYFDRVPGGYRVKRVLRDRIVFAEHNVLTDPPFTRMHLITCRNLLIYMRSEAQSRILHAIHFALNPNGTLFLGSSESCGSLADEFDEVHSRARLFRKRRDVRLAIESKSRTRNPLLPTADSPRPAPVVDFDRLSAVFLSELVPCCLVLDDEGNVLHTYGETRRFLSVPSGRASNSILRMVSGPMRGVLSTAMQHAKRVEGGVTYDEVAIEDVDGSDCIDMTVRYLKPRRESEYGLFLVLIGDTKEFDGRGEESYSSTATDKEEIERLGHELQYTKENLQATIEELETTNEELQSTNEELLASNEELQSTNEELHSVNEELYTVNAEHQSKIDELVRMTSDMENLLRSTGVGTVFLDRLLCIRKYTPKAAEVIHLLDSDIGRPISHLTSVFDRVDIAGRCLSVVETGSEDEFVTTDSSGVRRLVRIVPYVVSGQVDGVVLSLIDTEEMIQAAQDEYTGRLRATLEGLDELALEMDPACHEFRFLSRSFQSRFGIDVEQAYQDRSAFFGAVAPEDRERVEAAFSEAAESGSLDLSFRFSKEGSVPSPVHARMVMLHGEDGATVGFFGRCLDLTLEHELREHAAVCEVTPDCDQILSVSPAVERLWGVDAARLVSDPASFFESVRPEERDDLRSVIASARTEGRIEAECRLRGEDGVERSVRLRGWPKHDAMSGRVLRVVLVVAETGV